MTLLMEFSLNVLVACLLGVTIFYCWLLNKRIQVLQDSRSELAELLLHFDQSTQKAAESVKALQNASRKIGETIQERIGKAGQVSDDLAYMIDRADKLADQMEAGIAIARQTEKISRNPATTARPIATPISANEVATAEPAKTSKKQPANSLQSLLQKVAERGSDPVLRSSQAFSQNGYGRTRSEHEAELIEALKAGTKV